MRGVFPAPFAVFFKSQFTLALFEVFARPIVVALAGGALEPYEVVLGHNSIGVLHFPAEGENRTPGINLTMVAFCH